MTLVQVVFEAFVSRRARANVLEEVHRQMSRLNAVDEQVKLARELIEDLSDCIKHLQDSKADYQKTIRELRAAKDKADGKVRHLDPQKPGT
jgi:peptidoglycan hydrolase CwlO-like protein